MSAGKFVGYLLAYFGTVVVIANNNNNNDDNNNDNDRFNEVTLRERRWRIQRFYLRLIK
jgi:hypothetical protein